jgi:peroxiredoxin
MSDKKIQAGERLPEATLRKMTEKGPEAIKASDFFKGRKVVVFAIPGAFTPTCHNEHLPSFTKNAATFKTKGVAEVACIAVNDPFVLSAWAKSVPGAEKITFLSDGNAEFTKAIGMAFDGSGFGMGTRSRRYAMVVEDGRVKSIDVEENPGACSISSGPSILKKL